MIKLMQKPYHLVLNTVNADGEMTEVTRFIATPPVATGLNEDGKLGKDKNGNWIRVFTVTDSTSDEFPAGKKIVMEHIPGEFPTATLEDGRKIVVTPIAGVRAKKPRKAKVEAPASMTSEA